MNDVKDLHQRGNIHRKRLHIKIMIVIEKKMVYSRKILIQIWNFNARNTELTMDSNPVTAGRDPLVYTRTMESLMLINLFIFV